MNTSHTPGPWSVWTFADSDGADDARHVAVGPVAGGLAVADVVACNAHGTYTAATEAQGRANAALIAAAPDLLAALQWALSQIEDDLDLDHQAALQAAHAAVARATGDAA